MRGLIVVPFRSAEQMRDDGVRFGMFKIGQAVCGLGAMVALFALAQGAFLNVTTLTVVAGLSAMGFAVGAYLCSRRLNFPQSPHVTLTELDEMHDLGVETEMIEKIVATCLVGTAGELQAGRTAEALLARLRAAR